MNTLKFQHNLKFYRPDISKFISSPLSSSSEVNPVSLFKHFFPTRTVGIHFSAPNKSDLSVIRSSRFANIFLLIHPPDVFFFVNSGLFSTLDNFEKFIEPSKYAVSFSSSRYEIFIKLCRRTEKFSAINGERKKNEVRALKRKKKYILSGGNPPPPFLFPWDGYKIAPESSISPLADGR